MKEPANFAGIDGESYTIGDDHRYVLLAVKGVDTPDRYIYDPNGLSTVRCLEFIFEIPKELTLVGFGWNYDVNMIIRDLPQKNLIELWKTGTTFWNTYSLNWIPSKFLNIRSGSRSRRIYDVFGFFQSSFVTALEKWGFTPQDDMEEMKTQRSSFSGEMKERMINYCLNECEQLAELMYALQDALIGVGLQTKNWIGAGAIAKELMNRYQIKEYHAYDSDYELEGIEDEIRRAYYGGRVELFKQGSFKSLWDYDIISAYPSKAMLLPTLSGGRWSEVSAYDSQSSFSLWDVQWDIPEATLCPFPVRKSGNIIYPRNGRGTYHGVEVKAAKRIYGDKIKVNRGWIFEPVSNAKPFEFIPTEFAHRAELKKQGHAGEKCLKLGLNSIYGKLAQGAGYGDTAPPFQSYFWAGYITSATRATVLDVASKDISALVMIATDGIFFDSDPDITETIGLGGLELAKMDNCFVAQPGIYSFEDEDGTIVGKSRGFFTKEIDFDVLRKGYEENGPYFVADFPSTRFMGLGGCLLTKDMTSWRTWKESTRSLSLYPNRKFGEENKEGTFTRHIPPTIDESHISEKYKPKPGFATMTEEELEGEEQALIAHTIGTEQPMRSTI